MILSDFGVTGSPNLSLEVQNTIPHNKMHTGKCCIEKGIFAQSACVLGELEPFLARDVPEKVQKCGSGVISQAPVR